MSFKYQGSALLETWEKKFLFNFQLLPVWEFILIIFNVKKILGADFSQIS